MNPVLGFDPDILATMSPFRTPSRTLLQPEDLMIITSLFETNSVTRSSEMITLKSGRRSHMYVHLREDLTENPGVLGMVGYKIAQAARKTSMIAKRPCLIGVPTAGTALAQAASFADHYLMGRNGESICTRTMRSVKKSHGKNNSWVDGKVDNDRYSYGTVENVTTSSASLVDSVARLAEDGYNVEDMHHFVFVDREQGARQSLEKAGIRNVHFLYTLRDIVAAFAYLKLGNWNHSHHVEVEEECAPYIS